MANPFSFLPLGVYIIASLDKVSDNLAADSCNHHDPSDSIQVLRMFGRNELYFPRVATDTHAMVCPCVHLTGSAFGMSGHMCISCNTLGKYSSFVLNILKKFTVIGYATWVVQLSLSAVFLHKRAAEG